MWRPKGWIGQADWPDRVLSLSLKRTKIVGMKKILILAMAAFLISGSSFAYNNGGKGKDKGKKPATAKTCSGKQCCKKKAS
jgi:hypothetical protein